MNQTITFQRLELLSNDTNWFTNLPEVRLNVRTKEPVTPRQVQLLEDFIQREMGLCYSTPKTLEEVFLIIVELNRVKQILQSFQLFVRFKSSAFMSFSDHTKVES